MKFHFAHNCLFVRDLARSLAFYEEALGLKPVYKMHPADMDVELVFLGDGESAQLLEIGCPAGQDKPFDLGDNQFHLAFSVSDMEKAHALHEAMGVICRDSDLVPVYFIQDPDGYQIEIIPEGTPADAEFC